MNNLILIIFIAGVLYKYTGKHISIAVLLRHKMADKVSGFLKDFAKLLYKLYSI